MNRVELKLKAKEQIKGNILMLLLCSIIVGVINGVVGLIPYAGPAISLFISPVFAFGLILIHLDIRNGKKVELENLFKPFTDFVRVFLTYFLMGLFTALWSLLFIIPGIVKSFSYAMAPYIIAENPDISALDAINESKRIMNGHKADLFILELSFIGWYLLGIITIGIAFIYVYPYIALTTVNFYDSIKNTGSIPESEGCNCSCEPSFDEPVFGGEENSQPETPSKDETEDIVSDAEPCEKEEEAQEENADPGEEN